LAQSELFPLPNRCVEVFVDGACSGNPGPAGAGVYLIVSEGESKKEQFFSAFLGIATNNIAEYMAMYLALEALKEYSNAAISIFTDSELLAKQISGQYKVKNERLLPIYRKIKALIAKLKVDKIEHIPREKNKVADRLARRAVELGRMAGQSSRA